MNGGVGADTMAGGAGNDTDFADNASDVVNESAGEGTDTAWPAGPTRSPRAQRSSP